MRETIQSYLKLHGPSDLVELLADQVEILVAQGELPFSHELPKKLRETIDYFPSRTFDATRVLEIAAAEIESQQKNGEISQVANWPDQIRRIVRLGS